MRKNSKGIILPRTYTKEVWERGGERKEHEKYIGKYYISWSQVESVRGSSGFNTSLRGDYEYIRSYFYGEKYPDMGWATYGIHFESYITLRNKKDRTDEEEKEFQESSSSFNAEEKKVLDTIEPLGVYQYEICFYIEELDIIVLGYLDDMTPPVNGVVELLRDYKTKSKSTMEDLKNPDKYQLELYISALKQIGLTVKSAEYFVSERLGGRECMMGGGREVLTVGNNTWRIPRQWNDERLQTTKNIVIDSVKKISKLYESYLFLKS